MTLDALAAAFHDLTLPKADWTHAAHLRVGLWHLLRFPPDTSLTLLRDGIRRYNLSVGGQNTDTAGYHETVTAFYVWAIDRFLASADRTRPAEELADELVQACGDKELPLRYWTREVLFSTAARLGWVPPDLRPLEVAAPKVGAT